MGINELKAGDKIRLPHLKAGYDTFEIIGFSGTLQDLDLFTFKIYVKDHRGETIILYPSDIKDCIFVKGSEGL